ncbi:MAG: CPBP family intramembrane metalloprotease [Muribaculaceae bacterium]|nr:CPBP family intramembrane metalloprotease [Muribaculaceae bacterium]
MAKFSNNDWIKWLEIDRKPKIKSFLGIIVLYIISLPAMEWLIEWNSSLHLPESMSGIESQLRAWEESAESTTQMLLDSHGWLSVLVGVCVIGILTGFSEELFFRGGLQGIFTRSAINKNAAVWMAAMIFSLMHFQFFGFLPRLLMGAFFGYLLLWTRSIWVPAFAHILNNSIVVISSYLTGNSEDSILELNEMPTFLNGSVSACISLILTILFFIYLRDILFKTSKEEEKGWQRSQLPVSTER